MVITPLIMAQFLNLKLFLNVENIKGSTINESGGGGSGKSEKKIVSGPFQEKKLQVPRG